MVFNCTSKLSTLMFLRVSIGALKQRGQFFFIKLLSLLWHELSTELQNSNRSRVNCVFLIRVCVCVCEFQMLRIKFYELLKIMLLTMGLFKDLRTTTFSSKLLLFVFLFEYTGTNFYFLFSFERSLRCIGFTKTIVRWHFAILKREKKNYPFIELSFSFVYESAQGNTIC